MYLHDTHCAMHSVHCTGHFMKNNAFYKLIIKCIINQLVMLILIINIKTIQFTPNKYIYLL